jgi:hypothetical protein
MQAALNSLIAKLDSQHEADQLGITLKRFQTIIQLRMDMSPNFVDSVINITKKDSKIHDDVVKIETMFAKNEWVTPELWIAFVNRVGEELQQQQLRKQQRQQLQLQQLRQRQPHQQTLTPEQHEELQQLTRLMGDNWERISSKLFNCEDRRTKELSQLLNIPCDIFGQILTYRGVNLTKSLYSNELNVDEETRFINEDVNRGLQENGTSLIDPTKWLYVINFLRELVRRPFTQPDESDDDQDRSRMLEPSPVPRMGRPTPQYIVGSHDLGQIIAHLNQIIDEEYDIFTEEEDETTVEFKQKYEKYMKNEPYIQLIMNVMGRELTPITHEEYEQLFGGAYSPQFKLLPAGHILLESFKRKKYKTSVDEAFQYACRAYLAANPLILSELERYEPEPKRLYVIARLMRYYLTFPFDRMEGHHLGGKKSRSKKRGRKSVHRRKKSSHKKRKSKKN